MADFKSFVNDIAVVDIKITSLNGSTKSIVPQVLGIYLQEDVQTPYMFAEIDIGDGIGLLEGLPIKGEEHIDIVLEIPVTGARLNYRFWVFAVSNLSSSLKNNTSFYKIKCVSEEVMANAAKLVQKGYNDTFDAIVADVIKNELRSSKQIKSQPTLGNQHWVIPNLKPLTAIDFIRKKAVSAANPYSPMLFFETQDGFVFDDLASLYERGVAEGKDNKTFVYNNVLVTNSGQNGTIVAFNAPEKRDTFEQVNNGAFNNRITTFDVITKKLTTYDFDYKSKQSSFKFFNSKTTHSEQFTSKFGEQFSRSYLIPIDTSKPEGFVDRVGDKQSYTNMILQHVSRVVLSGNPSKKMIRAGEVVFLHFPREMPDYKATSVSGKEDNEKSGYFFVKKIVHEILLATGIPSYKANCELVAGTAMEKR